MFKVILLVIGCVMISCTIKPKNQTPVVSTTLTNCQHTIIVDEKKYDSNTSDKFTLLDVEVKEHCLVVKINYAGGCGDVELELVDAGVIMESEPVQRNIKLLFDDDDDCEALVTKQFSFDLSSLKSKPYSHIIFRLEGWDKPIRY